MGPNIRAGLAQHIEKLKLLGYFCVILILASPLSQMLGTAWETANLPKTLILSLSVIGIDLESATVLFFGLFLGFLILMSIDVKKRWQAFLLWIGLGVALLGLQSMGLFLPNIDLVDEIIWLACGGAVGLLIGGGRKLFQLRDTDVMEFRRASTAIYYTIFILVAVAFFEYQVSYPQLLEVGTNSVQTQSVQSPNISFERENAIRNFAVSGLFVGTVRQFVKYDAEQDFFVLGPKASGKSLFLIGAYLEALKRSDSDGNQTPMKPSQDLMEMIESLDRDRSGWIIGATGQGQVKNLRFQFVQGSVFPKNVSISGVDYAGEYLNQLPDALTGALDENEGNDTLWELTTQIKAADTLLLVVDVERYINGEPLEISEYFSILQAADIDSVIIVATKADFFAEQFRDERGLEAHRYYDDFKQYVNEELEQSSQISTLLQETAGAEIHPVYFQTRVDESGERVPMRDESGTVMTVGFDPLLEKIGRL